jgi:hypothetical protein
MSVTVFAPRIALSSCTLYSVRCSLYVIFSTLHFEWREAVGDSEC